MRTNGRRITTVLVFAALVGLIGYLWWSTSPREFQGKLHKPNLIGIPEDPPPLAYLVTATGTYELDIPGHMRNRKLFRDLASMNGKEVIVRGKWGVRRTLWKKHRAIRVDDLRLR